MSHFLSQELNQLLTDVAHRVAAIDAKVAQTRENILAEFEGLAVVATKTKPTKIQHSTHEVPSLVAALSGGKSPKRTPAELEALTEDLLSYIRQNPGQRVEQISNGMARPS